MSTVIILGSNHSNTAEHYQSLGLGKSTLVLYADQSFSIGHTSVQDILDLTDLELVLKKTTDVYWAFPDKSEFEQDRYYYEFLYWLQEYNHRYHNVRNIADIKLDPYSWKFRAPKLSCHDMVFLGGSITAGEGLPDQSTWYSTKLAQYFNKNSVNIALDQSGTGVGNNDKTFDIFTQLDFVHGQLVVIQITPIDRVRWCDSDSVLQDLQLNNTRIPNHRAMISIFNRKYLIHRLLTNVRSMIKIAKLQKIKLVLWFDNYKLDAEFDQEQLCFYEFPEIISRVRLADYRIDYATDHVHPGVRSNQILADQIIQHIERLYQ
jgi:hypothetical protein